MAPTLQKTIWGRNRKGLAKIIKAGEMTEIFRRQNCQRVEQDPTGVAGSGKNSAWFQFETKGKLRKK